MITCAASNKKYNDGQECCKGYNATWSFCPNSAGCYLLEEETCCTDGSICEGEDCCDLVVSIMPWRGGKGLMSDRTHKQRRPFRRGRNRRVMLGRRGA